MKNLIVFGSAEINVEGEIFTFELTPWASLENNLTRFDPAMDALVASITAGGDNSAAFATYANVVQARAAFEAAYHLMTCANDDECGRAAMANAERVRAANIRWFEALAGKYDALAKESG